MPVTNLPFVQQGMSRYGMTTYFALGVMGNIFNCIMFTRHSYRRQPSSIYFLSLSLAALFLLIWSFIPTFYSFQNTDPQTISLIYCKVRMYGIHVCTQIVRFSVVLACVDRFFSTRTNVHIRSLHTVQMAKKFVFIICVIWMVVNIHIPIYTEIKNGICGMFGLYKLVFGIYQITIVAILPPVLMITFSALTIHSLHQRHGIHARIKQKDRYLLRMTIAEVMLNVFTGIPYSLNMVYGAATYYVVGKSAERIEIESFISFFVQFFAYFMSVAPFYLFIFVSKPFRNEFIDLVITCWGKCRQRRISIAPSTQRTITTAFHGAVTRHKQ